MRDQPRLAARGVLGAAQALLTAMFMPLWPLLGIGWLDQGGGWMALAVMEEAMAVWAYLIKAGARALVQQGISGWYALTLPLGAAVLGAMILVSTWKVVTRRGVTWKDRR